MYEDYNNKSYSITAEQSKEVELRQEKEFIVYYLRKALGMVGDVKISEAIAQLEKELEPKYEPSILNLKLESKTVKCEELKGWTGWVEEDGTVVAKKVYPDSVDGRMEKFHDEHCCSCDNELCYDVYDEHGRDVCESYNEEFKVDNKDDNTVYERVVVRNEDGEDEESNPELFKKLQRFWDEHCTVCGSQRCLGVYDKNWREGCKLYKEEIKDYIIMNKIDLKNIEMIDALASRRSCSQGGIDYYRNGAMDMATKKDFLFSKAIINARNSFDFPSNDMCKELVDNVINTIKYAYYDLVEETNKL